jgi:hypothetical protein
VAPWSFLLALGLGGLARGETVDLLPAVDTSVSTAGRDSVNGKLAHLGVGLGADSVPALQRAYLGFDLGRELSPGSAIERAVLRVYQVKTSGSPAKPLQVHRVREFWDEMSMTWNNQPQVVIPGVAANLPTTNVGWKEVDVTGLVRDWYAGAAPNFGLGLRSDEKLASERFFASKEANANRPHLRITLAQPAARFRRGDSNQSGKVDIADAVHVLGYLFSGGKKPGCLDAADMNGDGRLVITDGIYLLGHLFRGSQAPPPPFERCGPAKGLLGCARFDGCAEPSCPDPLADSIQLRLLSQTTPFQGRVRITGIVRNDGAVFDSNAGQQSAALYEEVPGVGSRRVSLREFEDLAPGESISLSYEREWDTAIEFQPSYRLEISYDPDIFIDGNPRNDDCDQDNNQLERSGEDVNALFE